MAPKHSRRTKLPGAARYRWTPQAVPSTAAPAVEAPAPAPLTTTPVTSLPPAHEAAVTPIQPPRAVEVEPTAAVAPVAAKSSNAAKATKPKKPKRPKAHKGRKACYSSVMLKLPYMPPVPKAAAPTLAAAPAAHPVPYPPRPIGFTRFTRQQIEREQYIKLKVKRLAAAAAREQRRNTKATARSATAAARMAAAAAAAAKRAEAEADRAVKAANAAAAAAEAEAAAAVLPTPSIPVASVDAAATAPPAVAETGPTAAALETTTTPPKHAIHGGSRGSQLRQQRLQAQKARSEKCMAAKATGKAPVKTAKLVAAEPAVTLPTDAAPAGQTTLPPESPIHGGSRASQLRQQRLQAEKARYEKLVAAQAAAADAVAETISSVGKQDALHAAGAHDDEYPEAAEEVLGAVVEETATELTAIAVTDAEFEAVPEAAQVVALEAEEVEAVNATEPAAEPAAVEAPAAVPEAPAVEKTAKSPKQQASRTSQLRQQRLQAEKARYERLVAAQAAAAIAAEVATDAAPEAISSTAQPHAKDVTEAAALFYDDYLEPVEEALEAAPEGAVPELAADADANVDVEAVEAAPELVADADVEAEPEAVLEAAVEVAEEVEAAVDDAAPELAADADAEVEAVEVVETTHALVAQVEAEVEAAAVEAVVEAADPTPEFTDDAEVEAALEAAEEVAAPAEEFEEVDAVEAVEMAKAVPVAAAREVEEAPQASAARNLGAALASAFACELEAEEAALAAPAVEESRPAPRTVKSAKKSIRRQSKLAALRQQVRQNATGEPTIEVEAVTAEPLVEAALASLTLPSGHVTVESFTEQEMVLRRTSIDAPWDVSLKYDWSARALAVVDLPAFAPVDPRRAHPYVTLFQSKPLWHLKEVNGANATRLSEAMDAMKRTLTARFVFKQIK